MKVGIARLMMVAAIAGCEEKENQMKIRRLPALVLGVIFLALLVPTAMAQGTAYKLFSATPDTNAADGPGTNRGSALIDVTCPASPENEEGSGFSAVLSSTPNGSGNVLQDNWLQLTTGQGDGQVSANVCLGGYSDESNPSSHQGTDCFVTAYTGFGATPEAFGTFPSTATYGVLPLDIRNRLSSGLNHLRFDLINDGGPYGNSDIYLVTSCGKTQTQTLTFNPGSNVQQQATANCGATEGGACPNPDASSIKLTFDTVMQPFQVKVTFTEVDGDGVCVIPSSGNANDSTDFDCTWANFFGDSKPSYGNAGSNGLFTAPFLFTPAPTVNVPYCLHYASNNTKCVDINAELVGTAAPGTNFSGSIQLYAAWNASPTSILFPPIGGPWGSDPTVSPRFYDAPHDDSDTVDYAYPKPKGYPYSPSDQQKVFDVTGYFNPVGQAGVDGGIGTTKPAGGKTLNHFAVAFPLAPPDTGELVFPLQKKPDPACFIKGLPMPVLFEIENTNTNKFDPNGLTAPNYTRITVLQGTVPVLAPVLGQIVPVPFLHLYAAALSNANLTTSNSTLQTLYQLQIQSDLMAKPLTKNFVVKKSCP